MNSSSANYAEAARETMGWRFAATEDREPVIGMIADAAEDIVPGHPARQVEMLSPIGAAALSDSLYRPEITDRQQVMHNS